MITRVARQLGIGTESLRAWVHQAEDDGGSSGGHERGKGPHRPAGEGGEGAASGQ